MTNPNEPTHPFTNPARGIAALFILALVGLALVALTTTDDAPAFDVATEGAEPGALAAVAEEDGLDEIQFEAPVDHGDPPEHVEEGGEDATDPDEMSTTEVVAEQVDETTHETAQEAEQVSILGDDQVFRVINVDSDDTLNARTAAGTDFEVSFEFTHDASGVIRTDAASEFVGTNEWVEVFGPVAGSSGWVNTTFLEPMTVIDSSPCTFNGGGGTTTTSWTNTAGSASSDGVVVTDLDTFRFGSCIRTVVQVSTNFPWSQEPAIAATALPNDITVTGDTIDGISTIDFGQSIDAATDADARLVESDAAQSMFIYRSQAGNLAANIYGPSSILDVSFDNTNGTITIDVADTRPATGGVDPLLDAGTVVISSVEGSADHSATIAGFARPFEANLGVEVLVDGVPINVGWARDDGQTSWSNGISTSDWTSAWGVFDFTIEPDEGIELRDVVIRLDPEGASDTPTLIYLDLGDFLP